MEDNRLFCGCRGTIEVRRDFPAALILHSPFSILHSSFFILHSLFSILLLVAATSGVAGCGGSLFRWGRAAPASPEGSLPAFVDGRPMASASERPSELGTREGAVTLQLTFDVLRVDLPVLGARHAAKIWNHVDETQSDPRLTALLARNGLRIGTTPAEAWPALRVLFEAHQARSLSTRYAVQSAGPLNLCLGDLPADQAVFAYQRDGRLVGRTFDRGTKYLHVDYALDPADPTRTLLKITPEVRKFSTEKHWEDLDGRLQEVPRYEGQVFSDLSAELSVGPDVFVVLGPSEKADLPALIGSRFLTMEENNVTYETVICLTPQPVRLEHSGP